MKRTITKRKRRAGQSLVECALVIPLLLLLIVNVVNFGTFFYAWISVANAARAGAEYYTAGGITVGGAKVITASDVQQLVADDLSSLPNKGSVQVCVSTSKSAGVSCSNGGAAPADSPPAADTPEGSPGVTYLIGAVDVTYTYQPVLPTWDFPGLNIHTTLPPTTLHRQAKMRILQ